MAQLISLGSVKRCRMGTGWCMAPVKCQGTEQNTAHWFVQLEDNWAEHRCTCSSPFLQDLAKATVTACCCTKIYILVPQHLDKEVRKRFLDWG